MTRHAPYRRLLTHCLAAALSLPMVSALADDRGEAWLKVLQQEGVRERSLLPRALVAPGTRDPKAARAAEAAMKRYGGRVLAVQPSRKGYLVRLLLDDGRVVTVEIRE